MPSASVILRSAFAILLAALLALRVLTPAGFMPAFAHGVLMIVPCPDADPVPPPMAMRGQHHHHGPKALHQSCPYAAAAGLGGLPAELGLLAVAVLAGLALLLGRPYCFFERQRAHDRPPLRGPPIPA